MLEENRFGGIIDDLSEEPREPYSKADLADLKQFLVNDDIKNYLTRLLTPEGYDVSGVGVMSLESIRGELYASPGVNIAPYGYLPIASDGGGNAICFGVDGKVYWADHTGWAEDYINFKNRETGEWNEIPFIAENIPKALDLLSEDIPSFLERFLADEMEDELEALD